MVQTGDYLTPRWPDGTPRFNKPILTYWLVAGSYSVLGINPLASRLPFLVIGCMVVWLTYQLAMLLFANRWTATISVLITMCHVPLIVSSTSSLTDVPLCFFFY